MRQKYFLCAVFYEGVRDLSKNDDLGAGWNGTDRGAAVLAKSNMIFGARVWGVEGRRSEMGLDGAQGIPGMYIIFTDIHSFYRIIASFSDNVSYVISCPLDKR